MTNELAQFEPNYRLITLKLTPKNQNRETESPEDKELASRERSCTSSVELEHELAQIPQEESITWAPCTLVAQSGSAPKNPVGLGVLREECAIFKFWSSSPSTRRCGAFRARDDQHMFLVILTWSIFKTNVSPLCLERSFPRLGDCLSEIHTRLKTKWQFVIGSLLFTTGDTWTTTIKCRVDGLWWENGKCKRVDG